MTNISKPERVTQDRVIQLFTEKLGYTLEELDALGILGLHPPERREEAKAIFAGMFRGERLSWRRFP